MLGHGSVTLGHVVELVQRLRLHTRLDSTVNNPSNATNTLGALSKFLNENGKNSADAGK